MLITFQGDALFSAIQEKSRSVRVRLVDNNPKDKKDFLKNVDGKELQDLGWFEHGLSQSKLWATDFHYISRVSIALESYVFPYYGNRGILGSFLGTLWKIDGRYTEDMREINGINGGDIPKIYRNHARDTLGISAR